MLELNLAIRPIMWKNMANYLERIQIFTIFAACFVEKRGMRDCSIAF